MPTVSLSQTMGLSQKLTPAQIQIIKMLEVPACQMMQCVNEELQENPALEEGLDPDLPVQSEEQDNFSDQEEEYVNELQNEDFNYDEYIQDDETPDYKLQQSNYSADDSANEIPITAGTSFLEFLKRQVYLTKMNKDQRHIAKFVLGFIDEDGYLRSSTEELVDNLAFQEGIIVTDEEMADIVAQIQQFEPAGVGAKNLEECLLIQLNQKPQTAAIALARCIIECCFKQFSRHRFANVAEQLGVTIEEVHAATEEITRLNPKPGSAWNGTIYDRNQITVIPDFLVANHDGDLVISLNDDDIPELHVSREYKDMIKDLERGAKPTQEQRKAMQFVKSKVDSAIWFIDAIRQRNETLTRTMQAIVKRQQEFFLTGDEILIKPLKLQNIADDTKYDISTISRSTNNKYVQTEFGVFPLRQFFSERTTNEQGEEISTREVKKVLDEIIEAEDKTNPLTDEALKMALKEKGYPIARRTVAKYRDQLGYPVAQLRKTAIHL